MRLGGTDRPRQWLTSDLTDAARRGVQVIEVGVPFTDPMADGTTIQRANEVIPAHPRSSHASPPLIFAHPSLKAGGWSTGV